MKLFSKKVAVLAIAAIMTVGAFIAAPSAEAHNKGHNWDRRGWSNNRGHHHGWHKPQKKNWGPRHQHYRPSLGNHHRFEARRFDRWDRRYYR